MCVCLTFYLTHHASHITLHTTHHTPHTTPCSVNNAFLDGYSLLDRERIDRIRHIPCIAVQGGQDHICPPDTALDLHEVWPEMELKIPLRSGHSM